MHLDFHKTYLSILDFPRTNLPSFTLITGPNGAGKSHLLQAIHKGHITTDIAQANTPTQAIRLFDWSTLVPQDAEAFSSESLRNEKQHVQASLIHWKQNGAAIDRLRAVARKNNFPTEYIKNPYSLIPLSQEALQELTNNEDAQLEILNEIKDAAKKADAWILSQGDENVKAMLLGASAATNKAVALLEAKDLDSEIINWGRSDLFQQSFARLFVTYRDAKLSNMLSELRFSKGHKDTTFLSDDEFLEKHGPAPWEFVNDTIQEAGLDFTINAPDPVSFSAHTPQLTKTSSGITIPFSSLSSGEKI